MAFSDFLRDHHVWLFKENFNWVSGEDIKNHPFFYPSTMKMTWLSNTPNGMGAWGRGAEQKIYQAP